MPTIMVAIQYLRRVSNKEHRIKARKEKNNTCD